MKVPEGGPSEIKAALKSLMFHLKILPGSSSSPRCPSPSFRSGALVSDQLQLPTVVHLAFISWNVKMTFDLLRLVFFQQQQKC